MAVANNQKLPRELINRIMGNLRDIEDLDAASRVCKFWLPSAQQPLFGKLCLDGQRKFMTCAPFFQRRRHLGAMVHCLRLESDEPRSCISPGKLNGILSLMPSLEILDLSNVVLVPDSEKVRATQGVYSLLHLNWDVRGEPRAVLRALGLFSSVGQLVVHGASFKLPPRTESTTKLMDKLGPVMPFKLAVQRLTLKGEYGAEFYFEVLRRTATVDTLTIFRYDSPRLPSEMAPSSSFRKFLHDVGPRLEDVQLVFDHCPDVLEPSPDRDDGPAIDVEDLRVELSTLTNLHTVDFGIIIFKDVETQELEMTDISGACSSILAFLGAIPIGLSHLELGIYDTAKDIQTSEYGFKDEPGGKSEDEEGDDNENDEDEGEGEGAGKGAGEGEDEDNSGGGDGDEDEDEDEDEGEDEFQIEDIPEWMIEEIDLEGLRTILGRFPQLKEVVFHKAKSDALCDEEQGRITRELAEIANTVRVWFDDSHRLESHRGWN